MLKNGAIIWILEDDRTIADTLQYALESDGFVTLWWSEAMPLVEAMRNGEHPALLILDLGLPDLAGFEVIREIRRHSDLPVLIASARDELLDRVTGLELGADDYVTKPFSPREVVARVRAILRRHSPPTPTPSAPNGSLPLGPLWEHDPACLKISYTGVALELTRYEYRLLAQLLSSPGRVFTRDQLMERGWEDPGASLDRTVDAHVKTLRAKLRQIAPSREEIVTHRGVGYSLRRPDE
jgi:two-component system catabolic regulation response regulator CreB